MKKEIYGKREVEKEICGKREMEEEREWAGEVGGDWKRRKVALKELLCIWGAVN